MMTGLHSIVLRAILLYFTLSCSLCVMGAPPSSLKLVSVLYRHGDRSPASIYPKDINQVNAWSDGLGWLSNIGKQQQYELGQWLNKRYTGFLNTSRYHHEEIVVEASSVDRCLMSAYSNLAGLFPPGPTQKFRSDLPWQPIPVQTRPKNKDNKLALGVDCPRYNQLLDLAMKSPAIKKEEIENKAFYDMVVDKTGVSKENLRDIWAVADTLICERAHNMTWNDWVKKAGVWEKMDRLRNWSFEMLYSSAEMAKLEGGPLLKEIVGNMNNASKLSTPMPKFYMYSAHDTTVASLLSALNVFTGHQPMYRALVMVELHQIKEDHIVKVFYRNSTTADPVQLSPPGCPLDCKLETFVEAVKERIPVDWYKECQVISSSSSSSHLSAASWIVLLLGICLCTIIAVVLIVMVLRLRARRNITYSRL